MKYKAIFFDLDGTLLPMDMNVFTTGYFKGLAKKLDRYHIGSDKLIKAVWAGTGSMVKNDGKVTNNVLFWKTFEDMTGLSEDVVGADCLDFYENEFNDAKAYTEDNPLAKEAVRVSREKACIVALATNPLFPMIGQKTRMNWVGLSENDFDIVTSYETDSFCKPNPKYYISLCERLGVKPSECLMIGNDEEEDMYAAFCAGIKGYLVTDCAISSPKHPWNGDRGTFADMIDMLKGL